MVAKRPLFVSVIAGILIVFSAYLLFEIATTQSNRRLTIGILAITFLYYIPMALGLLTGKNWARILFLWFMLTSLIFQMKGEIHGLLVANIIYYLGSAYFLTRPVAIRFFLPTQEAARWNKTAYRVVTLLIIINFIGTFFVSTLKEVSEDFSQWATKTFYIGYVDHDIARLKLPSDWIETSVTRPVLNEWAALTQQGDFAAMAWGGLSALGTSEIDMKTGKVTKTNDKNAFTFGPGYLRENGTLMPCGLARYQLTFPKDTKDPLHQILKSQAIYGSAKHQYHRASDFKIIEYDSIRRGVRFIVWNWQRNDDPSHIYGIIIGLPSRDPDQQNLCHVSDVINSLELKGSDGTVWQATELNTQQSPTMTSVSGISIELDLTRLWQYGIDGETFFKRLGDYIKQPSNLSENTLSNFNPILKNDVDLKLMDIANIYKFGRGEHSPHDPWYLRIIKLRVNKCDYMNELEEYELRYIKAAADSQISFRLICGRQ